MIKTLAASSAAKAAALCICPVVGAGVAVTQIPQIRKLVHNATGPKKPIRKARALPRGVEAPCVPTTVASAVPSVVPRVAQVLPQARGLPAPELDTLPTTADTSGGVLPTNGSGGPADTGIFGGPFNPGGGIGGGSGGGGGGFVPVVVTPGTETPTTPVTPTVPILPNPGGGGVAPVPEPAAWVQMTGGFMVIGGAVRFARRHRVTVKA